CPRVSLARQVLSGWIGCSSCEVVTPAGHDVCMATRAQAQAILEQLAGPDAHMRDDEWTAIEALVVQRRRALVVQRTVWGKSAVYFISAKLLRASGHGPTGIASPLERQS